jgi:hypothetical protein
LLQKMLGWHFTTVIYPNPVVDEVTVSLDEDGEDTIEIYNDNGQRIYKKKVKNLKKGLKYNMRGKKTGTYFAKINCKGKVYTAIILKKK